MSNGKFRNTDRARQLILFDDLCFGNISPTDIDAFIDFQNKIFILVEVKHGDSPIPFGQKLALERICDASTVAGKRCFVLEAHHNTSGDISLGVLPVTAYYYRGKWRNPKQNKTVRETVEIIIA